MNLANFKEKYLTYISLLQEQGYSADYIALHKRAGAYVIESSGNESEISFEDIISKLSRKYKNGYLVGLRNSIGRIKFFAETGTEPGTSLQISRFMKEYSYDKLNGEFKFLIDEYYRIEKERGKLKFSTIHRNACCTASFLAFFAQKGMSQLSQICRHDIVLEAFSPDQKRHGSVHVVYCINRVLTICSESFPDDICYRISILLPEYPKKHKLYQYLDRQEELKVKSALKSDKVSLRDQAIGILAYYTGLRSGDIAQLRFEDVDIETDTLTFTQHKTGTPMSIPLRPNVGNALYDYIINERPKVDDEHIFLTAHSHIHCPMRGQMIFDVASNIYNVAEIRLKKGDKRGAHLLRHHFATDLISKDVRSAVVTELMGHRSPESVKAYIDADIEHLREYALDVSQYKNVQAPILFSFRSVLQDEMTAYRNELIKNGNWNYLQNTVLNSLDKYLYEVQQSEQNHSIQYYMVSWQTAGPKEFRCNYENRIKVGNQFINYLNESCGYNLHAIDAAYIEPIKITPFSKDFKSKARGLFQEFVNHRKASNRWPGLYDRSLHSFDNYCFTYYPDEELSQKQIDEWCCRRETENARSRSTRVAVINTFIKYLQKHRKGDFYVVDVCRNGKFMGAPSTIAHSFTKDELNNFFFALTHITRDRDKHSLKAQICNLVVPTMFFVAYSTGLRTCELRELDSCDVDFEIGVINVRHTKGYIEHRVAIHPSMMEILKTYDGQLSKLVPNRKCFFPNYQDKHYSQITMSYHFEQAWFMYNVAYARPYDLRHNYATTNINSFPADADLFNKKLLYLSRTMGHLSIEQTMYYFSSSPELYSIMMEKKENTFASIISDSYEEK